MQLRKLILQEHSKKQTMKIVNFIGTNQKRFDELIALCLGADMVFAQRASWVYRYCVESGPMLKEKQISRILKRIWKVSHSAVRRNFIKSLEYISIPESLEAPVISLCFELINSRDEFVAIKVYAMYYLFSCCLKYPDLKPELKSSIETQLEFERPAFLSASKKILKKFKSIKSISAN